MNDFVFDWWPDALAYVLLVELVALATMGGFQGLAKLLGRNEPNDFFVIFYRVFWRAFAKPRLYPVPINYEPVPPKREASGASIDQAAALDDDDVEALLGGIDLPGDEPATDGNVPDDEAEAMTVEVVVDGNADRDAVTAIEATAIRVATTVSAESGLANATALDQVGLALGVPRHQMSIVSGHTRAEKTLRINGLSAAELDARLASAAASCQPADDGWGDEESVAFRA